MEASFLMACKFANPKFQKSTINPMDKILIIGACGQLGTELTLKLRELKGVENVIASDLLDDPVDLLKDGPYEKLNIMNKESFDMILEKHQINQVYHLAAILSAKGEQNPHFAWQLNMESLLTVLDAGKDRLKQDLLAELYSCFWSGHSQRKHTSKHGNESQYRIWHIKTGRRTMV
jgi:nucleoside-diphosphate-sugar epimerase